MRIALIGNTESHETIRIKEEAIKRYHEIDLLNFSDITFFVGTENTAITTSKGSVIDNYDVFIFRGINTDRGEAQVMARWLQKKGKTVVEKKLSDGRYVMTKLPYTLAENGVTVVPTTLKWELDEKYLKTLKYPVIIRKTTGSKGKGIMMAKNRSEIEKCFRLLGPKVLIQPYFMADHDYRILIINSRVIGCMKKTKPEGSITSNISTGGIAEKADLPDQVLGACINAASASRVDIAGVDVMEDKGVFHILEVNSMPQFKGFEEVTKINVGREIILYLEKLFFSTEAGKKSIIKNSLWVWALTKDGEKWLHEPERKILGLFDRAYTESFLVDNENKIYEKSKIEIKYKIKANIKLGK